MYRPRLVTALFVAAISGCSAAPESRRQAGSLPVTPQPTASEPFQEPRETPIVYAERSHPASLTPEQMRSIHNIALQIAPRGHRVWFVLVLDNDLREPGALLARVFYNPDSSTPRLRKGRYVGITQFGAHSFHSEPLRYCQVSAADKPFDDRSAVPAVKLLPFDPPTTETGAALLADGDLVQLVDAARIALESDRSCKGEPVYRIESRQDVFEVWFGWQTGPLSGGGCVLSMKRTAEGFRMESSGQWVS